MNMTLKELYQEVEKQTGIKAKKLYGDCTFDEVNKKLHVKLTSALDFQDNIIDFKEPSYGKN